MTVAHRYKWQRMAWWAQSNRDHKRLLNLKSSGAVQNTFWYTEIMEFLVGAAPTQSLEHSSAEARRNRVNVAWRNVDHFYFRDSGADDWKCGLTRHVLPTVAYDMLMSHTHTRTHIHFVPSAMNSFCACGDKTVSVHHFKCSAEIQA